MWILVLEDDVFFILLIFLVICLEVLVVDEVSYVVGRESGDITERGGILGRDSSSLVYSFVSFWLRDFGYVR